MLSPLLKIFKFTLGKNSFLLSFSFLFLSIYSNLFSQDQKDGQLYIFGVVKDVENSKKMDGVTVSVKKNGKEIDKLVTNTSGKYEFFLDIAGDYLIEYSKAGIVSKKVALDSKNVPLDDATAGFSMNIDMTLFKTMEGLDVSILNQPIGRAKYNAETAQLEFDYEYTKTIKDQLNKMMSEFDQRQKLLTKEQDQADKDAESKQLAFEKFVAEGDKNANAKIYEKAIINYEEAIKIKPDAAEVKVKLKDAQTKFNELNASKEKGEKYKKAIEEGDSFFRTEDFDKALTKYEEAIAIKSEEKYPKDQIAKTNKILEERKKLEASNKEFKDLVDKGDNYLKALDFVQAITNYQNALKIKPTDAEVKSKIEDAKNKEVDNKKGEENKKKYDEAIAGADKLLKALSYKEAIEQYNIALAIKPKETYPTEKINECKAKLEELSKKEENEKKQTEQNKLFDDLIAQADGLIAKSSFEEGIVKYNEALKIKEGDAPTKAKIEDATKKMNALKNAKETGEKYDAAIKEADKLFSGEKYTESSTKYTEASLLKPDEKYPKDRIDEITKLLEEIAKKEAENKAEDERKKGEELKAAEALEKFNTLVKQGDDAVENKKFNDAVSYYSEALTVKADDKKTKDKLENARQLLDSSMAQAEKDKSYMDLISQADENFKTKTWEESTKFYKQALEIKSSEAYPKQKLEEIEKIIKTEKEDGLAKEAMEKANAENEAKLKESQAKFDLLLADADNFMQKELYDQAIGKYSEALLIRNEDSFVVGKIEEAKQKKRESDNQKDVDARYQNIIDEADKQFAVQKYEDARSIYTNGMDLKPTEEYPKSKIEEIDKLLAERKANDENNLLKDNMRAEEEARLAEKKRLEEEERLKLEAENSTNAIDAEYNTYIEVGDKDFENENYDNALSNFSEALKIKPEAFYPKSRIEKINQLAAEKERQKLEQDKLADLQNEREKEKKNIKGTKQNIDSESERQAEEFMRQAREREQNEKYERVKKLIHDQQDHVEDFEEKANGSISANMDAIAGYKENQASYSKKFNGSDEKKNEAMNGYKEALFQQQNEQAKRNNEKLANENERIKKQYADLAEMPLAQEKMRTKNVDDVQMDKSKYQSYFKNLDKINSSNSLEAKEKIEKFRIENQSKTENLGRVSLLNANDVEKLKEAQTRFYSRKIDSQNDIIKDNKKLIDSQLKFATKLGERKNVQGEENYKNLKNQESQLSKQNENYAENADKSRQQNQKNVELVKIASTIQKENKFKSKLAEDFPEGVTEQSSTQGNKVIIRRIVVYGNEADDYRKVLDKSGSYYFKNGESITENTWSTETVISKE